MLICAPVIRGPCGIQFDGLGIAGIQQGRGFWVASLSTCAYYISCYFCMFIFVIINSFYTAMSNWKKRITVNSNQCGGRPCIRGMRIRVIDILDLLASGLSQDQILEELPDLEKENIKAALKYAGSKINHPIIAA